MKPLENDMKHVVGNATFALETNLHSIRLRCQRKQVDMNDILEVCDDMEKSVKRIKNFLLDHDKQ